MKYEMTVKELKELLSKYEDDAVVSLEGGEDRFGGFANLFVNDEAIMEYMD